MDDKIADNKIIYQKKREIINIEDRIDEKKATLKELDDVQEKYVSINKSISKCIDSIRKSIKGKNINNILDSIENDNNNNINIATDSTEEKKENIIKEIKNLNIQKDNIEKELKDEYRKENEKEKEIKKE